MAQQQPSTPIEVPAVPPGAFGPKVPSCGYLVEEIKGGVYWVTEGGYQCAFVVCDNEVIAIDAPPVPTIRESPPGEPGWERRSRCPGGGRLRRS